MRGWIVAVLAVACGGKGLSPEAAKVREGEESDLSDCSFIQKVTGTSSDGNATAAKNAAKEEAAKVGATHITWIIPCCSSVEGNAYRCDLPE